jgi:hypothetical protein
MAERSAGTPAGRRRITHADIARLLGDIDEAKAAAIAATGASLEELEEAFAYAQGEDDVMGEARKPLTGRAAEIYEILTTGPNMLDEER